MLEQAYNILLIGAMIVLMVLILFCLVRAIQGPKVPDRIVAINMIGTMTIMIIAILATYLGEGGLLDVCLIYAMISFLAVVVLTKIYMGVYRERERKHMKIAVGQKKSIALDDLPQKKKKKIFTAEKDENVDVRGEANVDEEANVREEANVDEEANVKEEAKEKEAAQV